MPEMPNVVASETIEVEWGNDIRDRTIQRYNDKTTRASENPTPTAGDLAFMEDTGDLLSYFSGSWRKFVPSGVVFPYAGSSIPAGYLLCNGQAVSRTTYSELFTAIGTAFGSGDGSTTFNVPDMRQRFPLGMADSGTGSTRGASGGDISHTHGPGSLGSSSAGTHDHEFSGATTSAAGSHSHAFSSATTSTAGSHTHSFTSGGPSSNVPVPGGTTVFSAGSSSHSHSGTSGSGGSHSHTLDVAAMTNPGNHTHTLSVSDMTDEGNHSHSVTSGVTASANPPYLAMPFIIRA